MAGGAGACAAGRVWSSGMKYVGSCEGVENDQGLVEALEGKEFEGAGADDLGEVISDCITGLAGQVLESYECPDCGEFSFKVEDWQGFTFWYFVSPVRVGACVPAEA